MFLAIHAKEIHKTFQSGCWKKRKKAALQGIDLQVRQGEIFGILGPNGAGKTTLLSILSTLLLPDRGEIHILGLDSIREGHRIREMINLSSGNANFLWSLKVEEVLHFFGMLYGLSGKERKARVESLIQMFELGEHREVSFDRLSTGMKQRLSLAKSLMNDPALLLLDEPTVGLDPNVSIHIRNQIQMLQRSRGMTILLTTHNMKEAEFLCDRIAFLKEGRIQALGTAQSLKKMIRIGDLIKIQYRGEVMEESLLRFEGVINYSISDGLCEIMVDDAEKRVGSLIAQLVRDGTHIQNVNVEQTNLEDVFVQFSKEVDSDPSFCV